MSSTAIATIPIKPDMDGAAVVDVPRDRRVPMSEKLGYGVGQISGALQTNAEANLITPVFVVMMGVSPAVMSGLGVLYRAWDAVGTLTIIVGLLGIPLFQWIAHRYGKRTALVAVMATIFCASVSTLLTYTPERPYLCMASGILLSPANAAIWILIPSMTGDIVDHDELQTAERREGAFASIFSWTYKLSTSLAAGMSGLLVELAGYDAASQTHQPPAALWAMRLLLAAVPAVVIGVAIVLSACYPLTTARIADIRRELESRRGTIG